MHNTDSLGWFWGHGINLHDKLYVNAINICCLIDNPLCARMGMLFACKELHYLTIVGECPLKQLFCEIIHEKKKTLKRFFRLFSGDFITNFTWKCAMLVCHFFPEMAIGNLLRSVDRYGSSDSWVYSFYICIHQWPLWLHWYICCYKYLI